MTLNEITSQLAAQYINWGRAYQADLERIYQDPAIKERLSNFLVEAVAASRPKVSVDPRAAIKQCLQLSAAANFRFGLLIGLLLDHPSPSQTTPPEQEELQRCFSCDSSGEVCLHCGMSRFNCDCLPDHYSPVRCALCEGTGELS